MTAFLLRFVLAGSLVACLPFVADLAGDRIAGVVLLFPVVTISGFLVLGVGRGMDSVAQASLASLMSLPAVGAFLLGVYVSARHHPSLALSLGAGTTGWILVASGIVLVSSNFRGGQ